MHPKLTKFSHVQYVNKYSAAYWGTSFVREMTRIELPEAKLEPVAESPIEEEPAKAVDSAHPTVEELKGGLAELHLHKEDAKGSVVQNGQVVLTPAANALAPHNSA